MTNKRLISFYGPPLLGWRLTVGHRFKRKLRLVAIEPHIRKRDGKASFVLHWIDGSGRHFTSGLRGNLTRVRKPKHPSEDPTATSDGVAS